MYKKNCHLLHKETTFNMNTTSKHKDNNKSQKKVKINPVYFAFINRITFIYI